MGDIDCDICNYCIQSYFINLNTLGCKVLDTTGYCPIKKVKIEKTEKNKKNDYNVRAA